MYAYKYKYIYMQIFKCIYNLTHAQITLMNPRHIQSLTYKP